MGCSRKEHDGPIELRLRKGLGRFVAQEQCAACLRPAGRKIKLSELGPQMMSWIPKWIEKPRKRFGFRTGAGNSKRRAAERYYRSREWKRLRAKRLELDNHECVGCGNEATEVDHVDYSRFGGQERMSDLQSLCSGCHREKRGARMMRGAA